MAEIQRKKKEAEERRKRKEAEAKADAARRKAERAEREAQFRKQREEEEVSEARFSFRVVTPPPPNSPPTPTTQRIANLKKIAKLPELREMKAKEIKERLKILGHTVTGCIEKEDFVKKVRRQVVCREGSRAGQAHPPPRSRLHLPPPPSQYCVVTGQLYKAAAVVNSSAGSAPGDDGSYFAFEEKIRAMSVKELTSFIKDRKGDVANLLEKSEIIDAALLLYTGVKSGGVKKAMGR